MRLVEIGGVYFNPDRVDAVTRKYVQGIAVMGTSIFIGGSDEPYIVGVDIEEVVKALTEVK